MSTAGPSAGPAEYPRRPEGQADEHVDAWAAELMRDVSIRRGVLTIPHECRAATSPDEAGSERVFTAGRGHALVVGHTAEGSLMVPVIARRYLVPGQRGRSSKARERPIDFVAQAFGGIVGP